jgi:streptogramin lyase
MLPYDVTADKNGEVWSGGEFSDRVPGLEAKTGKFVEYMLPRFANVRRVFMDHSSSPEFLDGNSQGRGPGRLQFTNHLYVRRMGGAAAIFALRKKAPVTIRRSGSLTPIA